MSPATITWLKRAAILLIAVVVVVLIAPRFFDQGLRFGIGAVAVVGYIAIFVGLPFLAWIVLGAIYKIVFKPYVRVWHINRIRNARYLREATHRNP